MTTLYPCTRQSRKSLFVFVMLAALTLLATILTSAVVNDDPYITYRYARNLLNGNGFVYNTGEAILSTTAPLYAFMLAAAMALHIAPPVASLILGAIATFGSSSLIFQIRQQGTDVSVTMIAALLLATSPLLWMATGMESATYLVLALAALSAAAHHKWRVAGLLAALAVLVRGDGVIVLGLIALSESIERRRLPWRSLLPATLIILPIAVLAFTTYGSPLPATLRAKTLQANLGITGFFPNARFLDGFVQLAKAYFEHSALYILFLPLLLIGATHLRSNRWAWPIVIWGALHLLGYTTLGVAPYRWYYIPLLPAISILTGLGLVALARRLSSRLALALILIATSALLTLQLRSIWEIYRSTDQNVPRADLIGFDALPETSGRLYREIGTWLRDHTPRDATVSVMEVGVIGYYAERRMVDFLGLLRPEVAAALGRRDIYWSLPHTLPDFVVLTSINPLYSYDLLADDWFRATYTPQIQFEDPRFFGSPMTVYSRHDTVAELKQYTIDQRVGDLHLTGYATEPTPLQRDSPIRIRLDWAKPAIASARVSVSLIGPHENIIASDRRTVDTFAWTPSGGSVYHTMVVASDIAPGRYRAYITVKSEEGAGEAFVGAWKVPLEPVSLPTALSPQSARFADALDLLGYTLEPSAADIKAGDELELTLYWRSQQTVARDYTVFVHIENESGQLILTKDGEPHQASYPTSIWSRGEIVDDTRNIQLPHDLPPDEYRISIGLYLLESGQRLTTSDGSDQIVLTTFSIPQP